MCLACQNGSRGRHRQRFVRLRPAEHDVAIVLLCARITMQLSDTTRRGERE